MLAVDFMGFLLYVTCCFFFTPLLCVCVCVCVCVCLTFVGEGNGNPLQYSCLENRMDPGAWQATVLGVSRVRHDLATKLLLH